MSKVIRSNHYEIFIGNDTFFQLEKFLFKKHYERSQKFILVDENTEQHCLPLLRERVKVLNDATVLQIESGEKNKNLETCAFLWSQLTESRADRRSLVINLGGGMIGDVGGFVASTYMRGIDFINVPTTLLSMVDASVGGKTGIDFRGLKNRIGTFTKPEGVFISPVFLKTLPEREMKSGFAEIIKHTLIADEEKWNQLRTIDSITNVDLFKTIGESVQIKNEIVNGDFKEKNKRKTLNFGHTIGHAVESYSLQNHAEPMKHGETVALGIIGELFLSHRLLSFPENKMNEVIEFIQKNFQLQNEFDANEIFELMKSDKKNSGPEINFILLEDIGRPSINQYPDEQLIKEAMQFAFQHAKSFSHQ